MASVELMGWNKKASRWFKRLPVELGSKIVAVGCPTLEKMYPQVYENPTKEGSRNAANQWWKDKLAALSVQSVSDPRQNAGYWIEKLREHKARHKWLTNNGDEAGTQLQAEIVEKIETLLKEPELPSPNFPYTADSEAWGHAPEAYKTIPGDSTPDEVWRDRLNRPTKPSVKFSIELLMKSFLTHRLTDTVGKGITAERVSNLGGELAHFVKWAPEDDVRKINGLSLIEFRSHLLGLVEKRTLSKDRARDIMSAVRRFIRWCFDTAEVIETIPRNLDSKDLAITVPVRKVKTWSDSELETLLKSAPERQKLWYLLMLNTGCGAYEIALLANHDPNVREDDRDDVYFSTPRIDWQAGTVTRKRSKTAGFKRVPTVTHRLWPETMKLLKKLGNQKGTGPVLTTERGTPLVRRGERKDESFDVKRHDVIGREYRRLRVKVKKTAKITLPSIKLLRHTSASRFDRNNEFSRYTLFFLGHSPSGVAARHYIDPSQEQFDRAVEWLGKEFGVVG